MDSQRGLCLSSMRPLQLPQEGIGSKELMRLHIYIYILILYLKILNFCCRYVEVFGITDYIGIIENSMDIDSELSLNSQRHPHGT